MSTNLCTKQSFKQAYDSDELDASLLIAPLVFFMAPNDPRMLATIAAIRKAPRDGMCTLYCFAFCILAMSLRLLAGGLTANHLVMRYTAFDGFSEMEGCEEYNFYIANFIA